MDLFYNIVVNVGIKNPEPLWNHTVPIVTTGMSIMVACACTFKPLFDRVFTYLKTNLSTGLTLPQVSESQEHVITIGRMRQRPKNGIHEDIKLTDRADSVRSVHSDHLPL